MSVSQRDIVEVNFRLPEGTFKPHPVIVISSNLVHEYEEAFIGVMASSKDYEDEFCFELKEYMVTKAPKERCIVKCHLISMFLEKDILGRHGSVKRDFFIPLMQHILSTSLAIE